VVGQTHEVTMHGAEKGWFRHPDPNVDLVCLPYTDLFDILASKGKKLFAIDLTRDLIPTDSDIGEMIGVERVVMVGYPDGIWDRKNNLPVHPD
jgi:hypothetical protein